MVVHLLSAVKYWIEAVFPHVTFQYDLVRRQKGASCICLTKTGPLNVA